MSAVLFFIAAIGALTGAIGVVLLRNPFYSVLALVVHLIALAALFLLLEAQFVAAAQVVVYAGAVMVLYVFVVAYIGGADEPLASGGGALKVLGPLFALAVADRAVHRDARLGADGRSPSQGAHLVPAFGTPRDIGRLFLTTYLFPFELASLLLMVAAVGAVVLARRRRGLEADRRGSRAPRSVAERRRSTPARMAETTGVRRTAPPSRPRPRPKPSRPASVTSGSEGGW